MSEWITIPARKRGERQTIGVTMAWRLTHVGRRAAFVTIGRLAMERLGWPQKGRVVVAHDPAGTMLRATLSKDGRALDGRNGFGVFSTAIPWLDAEAPAQKATPMESRVEGGALIMVLPAWARKPAPVEPQGRAIPLAQPKPAAKVPSKKDAPKPSDAAPPDRRDEIEAKALLRKGTPAREVAEDFGIGLGIVTRWHDEVLAEKGRAA